MKGIVSVGGSVALIGLLMGSVGWGHATGTSKTGKTGAVVSQGDVLLGVSEARVAFGVDGTDVRVGVIADGAHGIPTAQASSDLPATLSMFQACDPVIANTTCQTGTAMLEVIHDLAPGAELAVCSATTRADMIGCVDTLSSTFFPTDSERQKPDIIAVDNVAVTAASGFGSIFPGTAAAAAHVAGIVALVRSAAPAGEAEQVGAAVQESARDIEAPGFDVLSGAGLIDALAALQMVTGMQPAPLGVLENPQPGGAASGAGVIFGWVCSAEQVDIEIDGVVFQAAYGTSRGDTFDECEDTDNGFGLLINWNLVGDGEHTVRALADGIAFGTALVSVTTLGTEFLSGAEGVFTLADFPQTGDSVDIAWQQALQNFVIIGAAGSGGGSNGSPPAVLENPQAGAFASGAGIVSGWVCSAGQVDIEIDGVVFQAAYGTSRGDTFDACGDTDNGFGLLVNWNLFGGGVHVLRALADGMEFANVSFVVTTLGEEFLTGAGGTFPLDDFPEAGQNVEVEWQEPQQNFVIVGMS